MGDRASRGPAWLILFALGPMASARAEAGAPRDKVFVPPVRGEGFNAQTLGALLDLVVVAANRTTLVDVVTIEDVSDMLSHEKRKDALGCSSVACAIEIGGALGGWCFTAFAAEGQKALC